MPIKPAIDSRNGGHPGTARNMPMIAVNTISATTRGLVSSRYWLNMVGLIAAQDTQLVIPAKAGIHLYLLTLGKWIPPSLALRARPFRGQLRCSRCVRHRNDAFQDCCA